MKGCWRQRIASVNCTESIDFGRKKNKKKNTMDANCKMKCIERGNSFADAYDFAGREIKRKLPTMSQHFSMRLIHPVVHLHE